MAENEKRPPLPLAGPKDDRRRAPDTSAETAGTPPTDTSTDWDQWMEKHGDRPPARPDVADETGKVTKR